MHLPTVFCCGTQRALFTNKIIIRWCRIIKLYLFTKFCACMYQVIELQKLVHPIVIYGPKLFFVVLQNGDVYTNFNIPLFCAFPNSITSSSFICWSIPVSEIREFSWMKKKMNSSKSGYF